MESGVRSFLRVEYVVYGDWGKLYMEHEGNCICKMGYVVYGHECAHAIVDEFEGHLISYERVDQTWI